MKASKRIHICICSFLVFLITMTNYVPAASKTDNIVIRVPFTEINGLMEIDDNGNRHGMMVDYLNEIAKYTGWQYEYIDTNGQEMVKDFLDGKYDLMGGTYYLPEMEAYCAYPDYSTGYSRSVLLSRKGDNSIRSADMHTLNGKTIGVYERATEKIRYLKEFISSNDIDCNLKYYSYEQSSVDGNLYKYLENGDVDLLLGNSSESNSELRVAFSFDSQPYYIVTALGNQEVLDGLNMALGKIFDSNPNFATERYAANFQNELMVDIHLNQDELDFIQEKETISVAVPKSYHPLSCKEFDYLHDGLTQDIIKEVAAFTGLDFSYIYVDFYVDAMHMVQQGEADMMGFFVGDENDSIENGLIRTSSYASLNCVVMRNKSVNFPQDDLIAAVIEGIGLPSDIQASKVQVYTSAADALDAVNQGEADFVFGTSGYLEFEMERGHFKNVIPTTLVNDREDISFALARPTDPQLLAIINKAVNNIPNSQKSKMLDQNMAFSGVGQFGIRELIYANPFMFFGILTLLIVLIAGTAIWILRTKMKSAILQSDLEKAEADSHAKGEFLSRMSHELRTPMNAVIGLADLTSMIPDLPENAKDNLIKLRTSSYYLLDLINDILDTSRIDSGRLKLASDPFLLDELLSKIQDMMISDAKRRGIEYTLEKKIEHCSVIGDSIRLRQVLTNLLSNAFKFTPEGGKVTLQVTETSYNEQHAVYKFKVIDSGVGIAPENQRRIFEIFEQVESNYSKSQGTGLGLPICKNIVEKMGSTIYLKSELGKGSEFFFEITLPINVSEKSNTTVRNKTISGDTLNGVRILIVEDNDLNAEIVSELLQVCGAEVTRVENGILAVERFEESQPQDFDLILMDIQMPEMNGLEATRAIRSLNRPDAREIPIVAMTANTFQTDIDAAMEAGMNDFISKPMDMERFYGLLCDILKI